MTASSSRIDPAIRLRRAIRANDPLLVKRILASHPQLLHNPDTSDTGLSNSNLHLAASLGHVHVCQFLVELGHEEGGPALNEHHETALMLGARAGHIETVHYLCQANPNWILCRDIQGRDAIMEASRGGHDTAVQILLTYVPGGAEAAVRREDIEGNTALHFASSSGHLLVLRTLLAAGADAAHENVWCWTPVAYSASVQAEVYLKGLINQTRAQNASLNSAQGTKSAVPEERKKGFHVPGVASLRLVRDDDSDKHRGPRSAK